METLFSSFFPLFPPLNTPLCIASELLLPEEVCAPWGLFLDGALRERNRRRRRLVHLGGGQEEKECGVVGSKLGKRVFLLFFFLVTSKEIANESAFARGVVARPF